MIENKSSDSFSPGYCEYLVPGYVSRNILLIRISAVAFAIVLLVLLFQLLSFIPQVFAVWFVLIAALVTAVFRMTVCEFEYTVAMGEMTVEAIYGRRYRRKVISVRIADADRVFPVDGFKDKTIEALRPDRVIYASPKKSEYLYCLYTKAESGKNAKTAIVFASCKKLNDSIRFYNRACLTERK